MKIFPWLEKFESNWRLFLPLNQRLCEMLTCLLDLLSPWFRIFGRNCKEMEYIVFLILLSFIFWIFWLAFSRQDFLRLSGYFKERGELSFAKSKLFLTLIESSLKDTHTIIGCSKFSICFTLSKELKCTAYFSSVQLIYVHLSQRINFLIVNYLSQFWDCFNLA